MQTSKTSSSSVLLIVGLIGGALALSCCGSSSLSSNGRARTPFDLSARAAHGRETNANAGCLVAQDPDGPGTSSWAFFDVSGALSYGALPQGDRLLDFSYAGYAGGGMAIPFASAQQTVAASGGRLVSPWCGTASPIPS